MESDDDCPPDLVPAQDLPSSHDAPSTMDAADTFGELSPTSPSAGKQAAGAVPVTIVTGFLGAGKTTLLNYILTQDHGRRIAVIENEVGDSMDIEALIARDGADGSMLADNLFELKNGCICCTVKDDLVTTLETLLERRSKFDYIIIETTGLANPGPVASVFWLDDALESALRLDAIVTLVDAKNIPRHLQRVPEEEGGTGEDAAAEKQKKWPKNEAAMQIAYADRVLINKTDLVSQDAIDDVVSKVRAINAVAEVRCTKRSTVDLAWVLDTRCFSSDLALAVEPHVAPGGVYAPETAPQQYGGGAPDNPGLGFDGAVVSRERGEVTGAAGGGHKEDGHHHATEEEYMKCAKASAEGPGGTACSVHDPLVTTYAVDLPGSLELQRLERWLGGLLWDPPAGGTEIYRVKGVVSVQERDERFVVQGVADLFEVTPAGASGSAWREGEARRCKVVFIGRFLSKDGLELGLKSCMV
eukprot:jgi/Undpi1/5547/HiC_scaffold_2.g00824.m1